MPHCLVYKKGDSSEINNIKCDFVRIRLNQIDEYKAKGYTTEIDDLKGKSEESEPVQIESKFTGKKKRKK